MPLLSTLLFGQPLSERGDGDVSKLGQALDRVLPATIPSFLSGMAQRPEGLVVMASTLTSMWREDMGNGQAVA